MRLYQRQSLAQIFKLHSQKEDIFQGQRSIKNATKLLELIDGLYRCTSQTREAVMQNVSLEDIYSLVTGTDEFLLEAAEKFSFYSLAFLINIGYIVCILRPKITEDSEIMKKWLTNLKNPALEKDKLESLVAALLVFNESEVTNALFCSRDSRLREAVLAAKGKEPWFEIGATHEEAEEAHKLMKQREEMVGAKTFDLMLENFKKIKAKNEAEKAKEKIGAMTDLTLKNL